MSGRDESTIDALGLDLEESRPDGTYLGDYDQVWIGDKWDIARRGETYELYRKGNYVWRVRSFVLACLIVADSEFLPGGLEQVAWLDSRRFNEGPAGDWFDILEPCDEQNPEPPEVWESLPEGDRRIDFEPVFRLLQAIRVQRRTPHET